jgi:hypothetical protein
MPGGEQLSRKQELAIAALLAEPTVEAAASRAGVSERTLQRWLRLPEFSGAYRAARFDLLDGTVKDLQQAGTRAVETLVKALGSKNVGDRIRAALGLLTQAQRGTELTEIEQRLRVLEARAKAFEGKQ